MRKTFLKVALIGLLATAMPAVVTSCKDYDNDIENLDSQVADLKTKLASVESAIAALPTKADVTAAQAAAVAQAKADLEAAKSQLQAAIDGKADKAAVEAINTELSTIKGQLEAIEALKGDVATALESINAAITDLKTNAVTKGQMDAALAAQKAELESYADGKVGTLVEDVEALQAAIDNSANDINAIKAQIEALANKINDATGGEGATSLEAVLRLMNGMITHIEVVNVAGNEDHRGYNSSLDLYTVTVAEDLVFGQGYASDGTGQLGFDKGTFTIAKQEVFKKGEVKTFTDSILIRVSPANAVVTADQIQLVNSQGADLNDYVQVTEVEAYKGLLTTAGSRSIANNGLHVVKFALKDAFDDVEGFINATDANNGEGSPALVQFAVAIADSEKELAEGREITSAYALTINATPNEPQYALDFDVVHNKVSTPVTQLRNRFLYANDQNRDNSSLMFPDFKDYETAMDEVYSKRIAQTNYSTAVTNGFTPVGDFAWVKNADEENVATYASAWGNDNRTYCDLLEVQLGDEFTVDMSRYNVDDKTGIYGFYVTLDMWRATESNGSEREAWKSVAPSISGINAVTTGDKINISISKDAKVDAGEILGFRVYAVNYDGTLVDPDGRAFYVVVNKPDEVVATASAVINAPAASMSATAEVEGLGDWTATVPSVIVSFETNGSFINGQKYNFINNNPDLQNNIYVKVGNNELHNGWGIGINRGNGTGYDVLKKIDVCLPNWEYGDGLTYTGTLTITDASTDLVLQTINVEIVKNVANNAPTGFGVNTANGFPATGDLTAVITSAAGTYDISTVFNWGKWNNTALTSGDYTEEVILQPKTDNFDANTIVANGGVFDVANASLENRNNAQNFIANVINNGKYPMSISYTYGKQYSYVPQKNADGSLVEVTTKVNGQEITYNPYELVYTTYKTSRNISFVTIASQLTFAWAAKYTPSLTYNVNGEIDLTKVLANQTITQSTPWKDATIAKLIEEKKITIPEVTLPAGLATYFTAAIDDDNNKIVLTAIKDTETPMVNVTGKIALTFTDDVDGSAPITLELPSITMNK